VVISVRKSFGDTFRMLMFKVKGSVDCALLMRYSL